MYSMAMHLARLYRLLQEDGRVYFRHSSSNHTIWPGKIALRNLKILPLQYLKKNMVESTLPIDQKVCVTFHVVTNMSNCYIMSKCLYSPLVRSINQKVIFANKIRPCRSLATLTFVLSITETSWLNPAVVP